MRVASLQELSYNQITMIKKTFDVTVTTEDFAQMVSTLMNVENTGLTLRVYKDRIEAFTITQDNSSVLVFSELKLVEPIAALEENEDVELWIKDLNKFNRLLKQQQSFAAARARAIDAKVREQKAMNLQQEAATNYNLYTNEYSHFKFTVKDNYILHSSKVVRSAKFLLGEMPARADIMGRRIGKAWFERFGVQGSFLLSASNLALMLKNSDFAAAAEKVYINQDGNSVVFDVNDKTKASSDSISMAIATMEQGEIETDKFIVPLKSLTILTLSKDQPSLVEMATNGNGNNRTAMVLVSTRSGSLFTKYLVNCKKS